MRKSHDLLVWLGAALCCGAGVFGAGCDSDSIDSGTAGAGTAGMLNTGGSSGSSGSGGTAGSGGGDAGAAGATGGSGGTAGAAGSAGAAGAAGAAGGETCLADESTATEMCNDLPYFTTQCEMTDSLAVQWCKFANEYLREGLFDAAFACLADLDGDPCLEAHGDAAGSCVAGAMGEACDDSANTADECADVVADCSTVTATACQGNLSGHSQGGRDAVVECYTTWRAGQADATGCSEAFESCVFGIAP